MNLFQNVKYGVNCREAAERYGVSVNRQGKALCPFHNDRHPSLLQAQHRLEEAQARDRVKERKARTRRLIQEGAILEKVLPEVRTMEPSALEDYLFRRLADSDEAACKAGN